MSDEAALLAAIAAHADDDTPRLVYADWLDEHDAPLQAEFIRLQCRMAAASAADADYCDLVERNAEVALRFRPLARAARPELPPEFAVPEPEVDGFRRGFLDRVGSAGGFRFGSLSEDEFQRVRDGIARLVAATPARHLALQNLTDDQVATVLRAPGAESVRALTLLPLAPWDDDEATLRVLAAAPTAVGLERLFLYMRTTTAGLAALALVPFARLARLELPMLNGPVRALAPLLAAPWFARLRAVRVAQSDAPVEAALVSALARLPHLDALDLRGGSAGVWPALGAARGFRHLAQLALHRGPTRTQAALLAKGRFPRLAELSARHVSTGAAVALARAPWFGQLRTLELTGDSLNDTFAAALARSAAAPHLRILRLTDTRFGQPGRALLADPAQFPALTTLDLNSNYQREPEGDTFPARLAPPRLRHLNLSGWNLGDAGAKALAANPHLANLTRLSLSRCGIGEKGFAALARSPHLQNLIELDLSSNNLTKAAALLDPDRLPRLAAAPLYGNRIGPAAAAKLHRARGAVV